MTKTSFKSSYSVQLDKYLVDFVKQVQLNIGCESVSEALDTLMTNFFKRNTVNSSVKDLEQVITSYNFSNDNYEKFNEISELSVKFKSIVLRYIIFSEANYPLNPLTEKNEFDIYYEIKRYLWKLLKERKRRRSTIRKYEAYQKNLGYIQALQDLSEHLCTLLKPIIPKGAGKNE